MSDLLRVLELPPEALVHSLGGLLWAAHHSLDVDLEATIQQLVDLTIIIVVIPDNHRAGQKNTY